MAGATLCCELKAMLKHLQRSVSKNRQPKTDLNLLIQVQAIASIGFDFGNDGQIIQSKWHWSLAELVSAVD